MLKAIRDTIRPLLSLNREYAVRRALYSVLPIGTPSPTPRYVHACVWKTASQWVRLILSDPRIYMASGHKPYVWSHLRDEPSQRRAFVHARRAAILACFGPPEQALEWCGDAPLTGFFVVRDPRDMIVSWYFSTRYSHDPTEGVIRHRAAMEGMDDERGLHYAIDRFAEEFQPLIEAWLALAADGAAVKVVRFEDLTGESSLATWSGILGHLEIDAKSALPAVLETYALSKLRGKPKSGKAGKYDAGGRRNWEEYWTTEMSDHLARLTGGLTSRMGYSA